MENNNIKKTFKQIHGEVKSIPATKRQQVLDVLGSESDQTFQDLLMGRRKRISPAEKDAIAKIYNKTADEIDWQDADKEKAIA